MGGATHIHMQIIIRTNTCTNHISGMELCHYMYMYMYVASFPGSTSQMRRIVWEVEPGNEATTYVSSSITHIVYRRVVMHPYLCLSIYPSLPPFLPPSLDPSLSPSLSHSSHLSLHVVCLLHMPGQWARPTLSHCQPPNTRPS